MGAGYRAADRPEGLGPLRETFAGPKGIAGYLYASLMFLVGVVLIARYPNEREVWALATFCVLLAISLVWLTRRNARNRVFVHAHGLRVVRGATTSEILWTDVTDTIVTRVSTGRQALYLHSLERTSGPPILYSGVENFEELEREVSRAIGAARVPALSHRLRNGERIWFGPRGPTLRIVSTEGTWCELPATELKGAAILVALLRALTKSTGA